MAGEPGHDPYFYIFPDTAVFTGSDSVGNVFSSSTLYKDTYNNVPCYKLSYNSAESITITINAYGQTYTASSYFGGSGDNIVLNLPAQTLYAWCDEGSTFTLYTQTPTPTTESTLYDKSGIPQDVTTYPDGGFGIDSITDSTHIVIREAI